MIIFTHRGLEPSKKRFYPESSYEALVGQLERGFGIEFDPNFCKDGIVVAHDSTLGRITENRDSRQFKDVGMKELADIRYGKEMKGRIPTFDEIFLLIEKSSSLHAVHLKAKYQNEADLEKLIDFLLRWRRILHKLIIFDITRKTASILKQKIPELQLAPSVSHSWDIERYGGVVGDTLLSMEEALAMKRDKLAEWVWLDEWDTLDKEGKKMFYTKENFSILRKAGYKIALVTPELHATSPGLYGGEAHEDAKSKEILFARIKEIIELEPDAVCTDYPEEVREMINRL